MTIAPPHHETIHLELDWTKLEVKETAKRWTFSGMALPWNTQINYYGTQIEFAKGSVVPRAKGMIVLYRHGEPIGKVTKQWDSDKGWNFEAFISKTQLGTDAHTLLEDEVIEELSIGFNPIEEKYNAETNVLTFLSVDAQEVSVTPFGRYGNTEITNVLEDATKKQKEQTMPAPTTDPEVPTPTAPTVPEVGHVTLEDLKQFEDDLSRKVAVEISNATKNLQPAGPKFKCLELSVGEVIRELNNGNIEMQAEIEKMIELSYTGLTTADGVIKDGWVGDLTRLVDSASTLRAFFSSDALPKEGNNIEFAELGTNTMNAAYTAQTAEGADLAYGEITITTRTAPVKTYGGWSQITRQAIERSTVNLLSRLLEAQAIAVGYALDLAMRTQFLALHAAQVTATNTVTVEGPETYQGWVKGLINAAKKLKVLGLSLDGLVVGPDVFEDLTDVAADDGRPVLLTDGAGVNNIGTLNAPGLSGTLAGIQVVVDPTIAVTGKAAFANKRAIRSYQSSVVRLQDSNIINLSEDFSIYTYAAFANEIPSALIPVVFESGS